MKKKEILIIFILSVLIAFISGQFLTECITPICLLGAVCKKLCYYRPLKGVLTLFLEPGQINKLLALLGSSKSIFFFSSLILGAIPWFVILSLSWWAIKAVANKFRWPKEIKNV